MIPTLLPRGRYTRYRRYLPPHDFIEDNAMIIIIDKDNLVRKKKGSLVRSSAFHSRTFEKENARTCRTIETIAIRANWTKFF